MDNESPSSLSQIQSELWFLLSSKNPNWDRMEHIFNKLLELDYALVPGELIQKLGNHYLQHLFREQEENETVTTCLLSYQAYGYTAPSVLKEILEQWKALQPSKPPPFPHPIPWSTPALMEGDASASMDSPIVNVWVYNNEKDWPVEIIICGRGIGWIREQVDNAVLATALRLSAKAADVLLEGFTCLRLTSEEIQQNVELPSDQLAVTLEALLGNEKFSLRQAASPSAAMKELVSELAELETKTGLVKVSRRSYVLRSEYQRSIKDKSLEYMESGVTLWRHTATDAERIILPYPISELNIKLPFALIESSDFRELHNLYRNDVIRAAATDALRRLNFYTSNLTDHSEYLRTYLNPETRAFLPETVEIKRQIDYATALVYELKESEEITRDEYCGKLLPGLIRSDIQWIRKIKHLLHDLSSAIAQPDSNLNRLTIARLLDAALRDLTLSSTPEVAMKFDAWKKKVQPFLWHLWETVLKNQGLKAENFTSRQQFFMLDMDVDEKSITIRPFSLADTKSTLFIFDARFPVPILQSVYDQLTVVSYKPQAEKAHQSLADWRRHVLDGNMTEARAALKSAIKYDPDVTLREIIDRYKKPFVSTQAFEKDANQTKQKVAPILARNLAVRLWIHHADQSCYAILRRAFEQIQNEPRESRLHRLADIPLTLAWLKTIRQFGQKDTPVQLERLLTGTPKNDIEREIQRYLKYAVQWDQAHVTRCLKKKDLLLTKTMRELHPQSYLNFAEWSMFNVLRALAFVDAAQEIALGVEDLDISGENPRSIYSKIGPALDAVWSNPFIQETSDQMDNLVNMLLGFQVI